jgi:hypothetical protein
MHGEMHKMGSFKGKVTSKVIIPLLEMMTFTRSTCVSLPPSSDISNAQDYIDWLVVSKHEPSLPIPFHHFC